MKKDVSILTMVTSSYNKSFHSSVNVHSVSQVEKSSSGGLLSRPIVQRSLKFLHSNDHRVDNSIKRRAGSTKGMLPKYTELARQSYYSIKKDYQTFNIERTQINSHNVYPILVPNIRKQITPRYYHNKNTLVPVKNEQRIVRSYSLVKRSSCIKYVRKNLCFERAGQFPFNRKNKKLVNIKLSKSIPKNKAGIKLRRKFIKLMNSKEKVEEKKEFSIRVIVNKKESNNE